MKKKNEPIFLLLILLFLFLGCRDSSKRAAYYLAKSARKLYNDKQYEDTQVKADSVQILFPSTYEQIEQAKKLSDSISLNVYRQRIDILDRQKYTYKSELCSSKNVDKNQELSARIDSLDILKQTYKAQINEIENKWAKQASSSQSCTACENR